MAASFSPDPTDRPFIRRLAQLVFGIVLLILFYKLTHIFILVFGAIIGAVLMRAVADLLDKALPIGGRIPLILAILLVLAAFYFTGWLFWVQLGGQGSDLVNRLPEALAALERSVTGNPVGAAIDNAARSSFGGSRIADILTGLGLGAGEILLNFIVIVVGAIFFAAQPRLYVRGALALVPPAIRADVALAVEECGQVLRLWLITQIICMTTMGLLVAGGLWLSGLESWAALGLLAGLSEFIPYVGPTVAMIPALALGAVEGGDKLLYAFLTYVVVRIIQTNFITPLVQRRVVQIPPALTLFAILGIGAVFGTYGLFFSAAMLVVGFVLVKQLYVRDVLDEETRIPGEERIELPEEADPAS